MRSQVPCVPVCPLAGESRQLTGGSRSARESDVDEGRRIGMIYRWRVQPGRRATRGVATCVRGRMCHRPRESLDQARVLSVLVRVAEGRLAVV